MKVKKTLILVFLTTFIAGCAAYLLFLNAKSPAISNPVISNHEKNELPAMKIAENLGNSPMQKEIPFTPEIFDLKDFSDDFVEPKYEFQIVDVLEHGNIYRKEEVVAKNGETWLGLFSNNGESHLKNTKLKIDFDFHPDGDEAVIKIKEEQPIFLVKNAKKLKAGKVVTLFQENSSEDVDFENQTNVMYRGFKREFQLGEKQYTLQIKDALTKSGEKVLALVLNTEAISQVITYEPYFNNDYLGSLLWVGDLDGDGKLDLYLNRNNWEKGYFSSSLFLSSESEKGKLVKKVAGFYTAGC